MHARERIKQIEVLMLVYLSITTCFFLGTWKFEARSTLSIFVLLWFSWTSTRQNCSEIMDFLL